MEQGPSQHITASAAAQACYTKVINDLVEAEDSSHSAQRRHVSSTRLQAASALDCTGTDKDSPDSCKKHFSLAMASTSTSTSSSASGTSTQTEVSHDALSNAGDRVNAQGIW
ncbi:hypothetical protein V5799_008294 [Amblyomma americanum]|uniref:Uncharacterized protein n=1 Tax=Amblyomma americanum TaxID=6943 RepID=A0AAQ4FF65_AMBAM